MQRSRLVRPCNEADVFLPLTFLPSGPFDTSGRSPILSCFPFSVLNPHFVLSL